MTTQPEALTITTLGGGTQSVVLRLEGPCDFETVEDLHTAADHALSELTPVGGCLTLDFTEVADTDSSALSALIRIKRATDASGITLHLTGIANPFMAILKMTGLQSYFANALAPAHLQHVPGVTIEQSVH